jgi:DNA-binding winged helix-turn-helix (wHTH) protein
MRLSFGDFVLDTDMRELRLGSRTLHLSPKAFQLLEILVENRPRAVSKTDLQERLWPDTFVVEKNLPNLIGEIRDVLGDDPSEPAFIRTVHRFGYAFRDGSSQARQTSVGEGAARFRVTWADGRALLEEGEHVLGRDPDLDLFFDSPSVSRRHALIRISAAQATVEDLGSKNGTFVRGCRIERPTRIVDGDVVTVGSIDMTVRAIRAAGSTQTVSRRSASRDDGSRPPGK